MIEPEQLPPDWSLVPLRRVLRKLSRRPDSRDGVITAYRSGRVTLRSANRAEGYTISEKEAGYQGVEPGDFVFHALDGFAGAVGVSDSRGKCTPVYHVCTTPAGDDPAFVAYAVRAMSALGYLDVQASTVRQRSVDFRTWDAFGRLVMPRPPAAAQVRLAAFLDQETARVDRLLVAKRRMRDALDERRWRVIDRLFEDDAEFVSRRRTALKHVAKFLRDGDWIEAPDITTEGIRLIQTGNIGRGTFKDHGDRFVSEATFRKLRCTEVFPGDILISRLASTLGHACLAPQLGTRMIASVDVVIMRPSAAVDPEYLVTYLSSDPPLSVARLEARGTTMQRLARTQVGEFRVPTPSLSRQRRVVERAAESTASILALAEPLDHQITLLQEHRQALITAAVTGQLDVARAVA